MGPKICAFARLLAAGVIIELLGHTPGSGVELTLWHMLLALVHRTLVHLDNCLAKLTAGNAFNLVIAARVELVLYHDLRQQP